jgi:hypothetical protein
MLDRRRFLAFVSAVGAVAPEALWGESNPGLRSIAEAEKLAGLEFTDAERELMLEGIEDLREDYRKMREVSLDNAVPPALRFDPDPVPVPLASPVPPRPFRLSAAPAPETAPADPEALAFAPVTRLARLLRRREVSSVALTRMYLARLKRLDPTLHAVVNFTEERALEAADRADREIAAGTDRGPLHGIPWGAKDLLAARGYPTTWGSVPFKEQVIDQDATVVERLEKAGVVLVVKLSPGVARRPARPGP